MKYMALCQWFASLINGGKPVITLPGSGRISANNAFFRRRSQKAAPKGRDLSENSCGLLDGIVFFAFCPGR